MTNAATPLAASLAPNEKAVTLTGGHDTDPRDRGRPVVLIAAALKVSDAVFREAFTHVHPAGPGQAPGREQVQQNKRALMDALGKYGVTNDRLDEVSNYYRYPPGRGETWRNRPATAVATIENGKVTRVTVTDGGAGYSSTPTVSIDGVGSVELKAEVAYGTDLKTNGAIRSIKVVRPTTQP